MGERLLESFETFGWKPDKALSDDDNMMDLLLLVTRNAKLKQGSMACILLRPAKEQQDGDDDDTKKESLVDRIQAVANNQELYTRKSSDIHAEIACIGQAARAGRSTENCTAYITMPPCKKCFTALYAAGIGRVVSVHKPPACYAPFADRVPMQGAADINETRRRIQVYLDAYKEQQEGSSQSVSEEVEKQDKKDDASMQANTSKQDLERGSKKQKTESE